MRFKTEERYGAAVLHLKGDVMGGPDGQKFHDEIHRLVGADQKHVVVDLGSGSSETVELVVPGVSVTVVKFYGMGSTDAAPPSADGARARLSSNRPNPFRATTQIDFELPSASEVTLDVFSPLGRRVARLFAGALPGGNHTFSFDGSGLSAGTYWYVLCVGGECASRPMLLVR